MATLLLSALGTLVGGPVGASIGALIGRSIDGRILGSGGGREGPRLSELSLSTSSYGMPIPRHHGRMRVAGQVIWATDLVEHRDKQGGGKSGPSVTTYSYAASFAVALSSRPLGAIGRIWADGKLLRGEAADLKVAGKFRFHEGHADQPCDPLIAAAESAACPAYRGIAYAVFEDLALADFGNRIPTLSFEVIGPESELSLAQLFGDTIADMDAPISLDGIDGISIDGPLSQTVAALDPFYPIDVNSGSGILSLTAATSGPTAVLPEAATSTDRQDFGGNVGYARRREREPEAPVSVLRYYDRDRDYQPGAQRASGRTRPGQPQTIELPATMTADQARRAVERAASRATSSRQTVSWRITHYDPAIRPGSIVTLPGHHGHWRIVSWEWREHGFDLALERQATVSLPVPSADPGRASTPVDLPIGPTSLAALELPWDGVSGTPVTLALASSATAGWAGAALYAEKEGSLTALGPSGRTRAILGHAETVLAPRAPFMMDRRSRVVVTLVDQAMVLQSATFAQLDVGANRALLGGELIQFADAEPLGGGRYRLSNLLRGRAATDDGIGDHQAGERFALLDGGGTALQNSALDGADNIAAIGLTDQSPVTAPIALAGISSRPLAPVHGSIVPALDGSAQLTWIRRARGAWQWRDGVDTPLQEQLERYVVEYTAGSGALARWESASPSLALGNAELAALRQSAVQGWFEVRQIGDLAVSNPLRIDPSIN